uniref:B30.2/SPRY domain-containing protein n=1 Tax=Meloidogyne hapla TaxID=6305 RepID=A0A1I8B2I7_MELHA
MNLGNIKNFDGIQDTSLFTKIAELTTELKNFARETEKVQFIRLSNKIDSCLYTNVNSSDKAYVTVNEGRIEYHETENRKNNYEIVLYAKNSFNKELNCCRSILFYFEVKMIMDNYSNSYAEIGFEEVKEVNATIYLSNAPYSGDNQKFNWKNGDTFGCGVVFPPNKSTDSYIFFTKNGKKLGKSIQLQENVDNLLPSISLCLCSVEVNFGNDYFYYDVSKHY